MAKLEVQILGLYVVEEFPHAELYRLLTEVLLGDIDIVEQHHTAIGHLREPCIEVVADGSKSMRAVDVQQVHRAVFEEVHGFVEVLTYQRSKRRVISCNVCGDFLE